jgi:hypothetical protein
VQLCPHPHLRPSLFGRDHVRRELVQVVLFFVALTMTAEPVSSDDDPTLLVPADGVRRDLDLRAILQA